MKRTILIAMLGLFGAAPAFAQPGPRGEARQEMGAARVERLAGKLGLDAAGTARLQQTFDKYRVQLAPLRKDAWQTRRALREQLAGAQPDESKVASLTSELQSDRQQMMAIAQQRSAELKSELTPSQYGKLVLARRSFGRGFRHHGRGHMNGNGGGNGEGGNGGNG
jgi:Spy/CpxP family protein refolding chaperone